MADDFQTNTANTIARGLNNISRATRGVIPYNKGALSVQQNEDMVHAQAISDAVPRMSAEEGSHLPAKAHPAYGRGK